MYKGKELPPGVECNEKGICRNFGILGPGKEVGDMNAPPPPTPSATAPSPPPASSSFDLPPPPPPSAATIRGAGDHPEADLCNLKNSDGPEQGVIFVNDPRAKDLFVSEEKYALAQRSKTGMPSVPGAGNTWVRLVVEKGSALRTGSVFGDGFIKRMGMAGEGKRDPSVIMIKMHYPILGEDMKDAVSLLFIPARFSSQSHAVLYNTI